MQADSHRSIFTLPLFPLHHVLFPYLPLQLHIFEERYRVMINGCIERNEPFGVVLIREGSEVGTPATPYEIGCVARIVAVKRLEDGRLLLWAVGESRFRILDYMEADLPYLIGKVEALEESAPSAEAAASAAEASMALFLRYLNLLATKAGVAMPEVELPAEPVALSFYIAAIAHFSEQDKQRLLEVADTDLRLQEERRLLQAQVEDLEAQYPAAQPAPNVLVAHPLDTNSEALQTYRQEGRN